MSDLAPDGVVEAKIGDYELVKLKDGQLIVRCRHCGQAEAGGRRDMVSMWWTELLLAASPPVHTGCTSKQMN